MANPSFRGRLEPAAHVATIVESAFVIVSVAFIWYELRLTNDLSKAENTQSLVEISSPLNLELAQSRELAALWVEGPSGYDAMDPVDRFRYETLLTWWLIMHENIYYQWTRGLLDAESYEPWDRDLRGFVETQQLHRLWDGMKPFYQPGFAGYVTSMLTETASP